MIAFCKGLPTKYYDMKSVTAATLRMGIRPAMRAASAIGCSASLATGLFVGASALAAAPALARVVTHQLSIPAQPLDEALKALGIAANEQLLYKKEIVVGKQSAPVNGNYPTEQALEILLQGSGLKVERTPSDVLLIREEGAGAQQSSVSDRTPEEGRRTNSMRRIQLAQAETGISAATQAPAESLGGLEEVIVSARRRDEDLMATPVSITAYTNEELTSRQVDSINQIALSTPGLNYRGTASTMANRASIYIRGVGQGDGSVTKQPGVAVYVDGVYISQATGGVFELLDIERVEVLRGPQGTLFGRNSIGGAIHAISIKPTNEFGGSFELTVGDFNRKRVRTSLNVPFTDTFYGKFSVALQQQDGYVATPNIPNSEGKGGKDYTVGRAAFRWLATDALTFDLTANYSHEVSGGPPLVLNSFNSSAVPPVQAALYNQITGPAQGLPPFTSDYVLPLDRYTSLELPLDPDTTFSPLLKGTDLKQRDTSYSYSLTAAWEINDSLTVKSISSYRHLDTNAPADNDVSPLDVSAVGDFYSGSQKTQELQLIGQAFDQRLNWTAGLFYFKEDMAQLNPIWFPQLQLVSGMDVDNKSSAAYGQFTYDFSERFSVTAGLRYTEEKLKSIVTDENQHVLAWFCVPAGPAGGGPPTASAACAAQHPGRSGWATFPPPPALGSFRITPNATYHSDATRTEPYLNFSFNVTDALMTYVSYSEGFKGGGFTQALTPGRVVDSFGPETAEVYEVGAKWSDHRVRLSASVFHTDYENLQVPVTFLGIGGSTTNAGSAVMKGAELEAVVAVTSRFQLSAGVAYLDAAYKELGPAVQGISLDSKIPGANEWQYNASASYRFSLGTGNLLARLDYAFIDKVYSTADNIAETLNPAVDLFNGSITYMPSAENWELALQVRNLTDEVYATNRGLSETSQGWTVATLAPPRELSARFAYRF